MEDKLRKVGIRIKELRTQRGMTQYLLAEKIGISQTNLSNIERGRTGATLQNLFKIQEVLGCKMADFFDGVGTTAADVKQQTNSSVSIDDAIKVLQMIKEIAQDK